MKWLLLVFVTGLVRFGDCGAVPCPPGALDCGESMKTDDELFKASQDSGALETECLAGTDWLSNCHSCRCSETGVAECKRMENCDQPIADPIRCKPNTSFARDCNTCVCLENGLGLCTIESCSRPVPVKSLLPRGKDCAPGTRWLSRCNRCVCSPDGFSVCDLKSCLGMESTPSMRCAPDTMWKNDCNTCWCTSGGLPMCTRIECLAGSVLGLPLDDLIMLKSPPADEGADHIERHSVCKPSDTFYIGCNTCHCNNYGTDYSCTNKPCPLSEDVEIFHELKDMKPIVPFIGEVATESNKAPKDAPKQVVCVANRIFIKDCNTCWCNEDGTSFVCTRKVCIPELPDEGYVDEKPEELRVIQKDCRPDEVFEIDCNMCRCNADGKSFSCTRRACVEPVDEDAKNATLKRARRLASDKEPPKTCQPGQEFRMDCNKCLCDNEGQNFSCTRNDCTAINNHYASNGGTRKRRETSEQLPMECEPGSVFDKECNVCRCTLDGQHALCTMKPCHSNNDESNNANSPLSETDPSFRCNPGEQFKRGCSDCSCSADGKSVFCTVLFCDQDVSPPPSR